VELALAPEAATPAAAGSARVAAPAAADLAAPEISLRDGSQGAQAPLR
jgi:hypothetical protein